MFGSKTILIADCSTYAALDLAAAVEDFDGRVAGPVSSLIEALAILDSDAVAGAIVDCELPQAASLIMRLVDQGVPVVVQTSLPLPNALAALEGRLPVLMRPIDAGSVISALTDEIGKSGCASSLARSPPPNSLAQNKLGSTPKQV